MLSFLSLNQYVESMLFCVLEELAYSVSSDTHSLFEAYHATPFLPEPSTASDSTKSRHGYDHVKGRINAVGEKGGDFIHVTVHKAVSSPYKWNESIILIADCDLAQATGDAWLAYGVCNCSMMNSEAGGVLDAKHEQWIINLRWNKRAQATCKLGTTVFLYSLTPFTSFLR